MRASACLLLISGSGSPGCWLLAKYLLGRPSGTVVSYRIEFEFIFVIAGIILLFFYHERDYICIVLMQFILELLEDQRVLLVQGTGFNWPNPDHFRLVFLPHEDDLREAIGRIAHFLETYRRRHGN